MKKVILRGQAQPVVHIDEIKDTHIVGIAGNGTKYFAVFTSGGSEGYSLINVANPDSLRTNSVWTIPLGSIREAIKYFTDSNEGSEVFVFDNKGELFNWLIKK